MTTNPDTTISFTDETDYTQQGDTYGAAQINEQNAKINDLDSNAYRQTDTAETSLADNDYVPFYDASASAKRKVLVSKFKEFLLGAFAPKVHDSNSAGTYGAATGSKFGHVKLSDSYTSSGGAASSSVGASSQAVYDAYRNRAPVNHASSDTTYGRGNASQYGHVKLSDSFSRSDGGAANGVGASSQAVNGVYNTLQNNVSGLDSRITDNTVGIGSIISELTANSNRIYMDYKNGKYGYNTSANRGADTFHPFNSIETGTLQIIVPGDTYTVNLGYRPARVWAYIDLSANGQYHTIIFDPVISTTTYIWMGCRPSGPADFWISIDEPLGQAATLGTFNVTDNGFTVNTNYYGGTLYYCASST